MSDNNGAASHDFETQHRQYLADCRARYTRAIETLPPRLLAVGVAIVTATYSGCGDSGQIDEVDFRSPKEDVITKKVPQDLKEEVETLLYDTLEFRHGGWENNDGGEGEFRWALASGDIEHTHRDFYIESDTSIHEGFDDLLGKGKAS